MRTRKWSIGVIVLVTLAAWASCALADTAVTVNPYGGMYTSIQHQISIGWRFYIDKTITITHLGLFDSPGNGPGLLGTHTVAIWRLPKTGGFDLKRQVTIGPGAELSANHAWVALTEPLTISPDPVPEGGFYERWMVGVWTPNYLYGLPPTTEGDALIFAMNAVTFDAENAGIIRFGDDLRYTCKDPAETFAEPWPAINTSDHYGVNFKYSVPGPTAEAGDPCDIYTSEQATTIIRGSATHTVPGTAMTYQWFEGAAVLGSGTVGENGEAPLNLALPVPALAIGPHTLKLEVTDGAYTSSDTMVLTVHNTPADAQVGPSQVVEIGRDAIIITGDVGDFDGDTVSYQWIKDGAILGSGTTTTPAGGAVVSIPDLVIPAGDPEFPLGVHEVKLVVSDDVSPDPDTTASTTVDVKDSTAPTLAPTASTTLLWPPNHQLVPVTIWANAADNGGGSITLTVDVQSDEPTCWWCGRRCGHHCAHWTQADWYIDSIDKDTGVIQLRLRSERFAWGDGRVYTITITATDESGNSSSAIVEVRVPHDRRRGR